MEFQVPQFIDVENKIVGPLTLRQFIYIGGGAGLCAIFFFYLPIVFALLLSAGAVAFVVALSFYRINNKPFIDILEAGFHYLVGAKLFLWKHEEPVAKKNAAPEAPEVRPAPRLTRSKLSELAWSLDVPIGQNSESDAPRSR